MRSIADHGRCGAACKAFDGITPQVTGIPLSPDERFGRGKAPEQPTGDTWPRRVGKDDLRLFPPEPTQPLRPVPEEVRLAAWPPETVLGPWDSRRFAMLDYELCAAPPMVVSPNLYAAAFCLKVPSQVQGLAFRPAQLESTKGEEATLAGQCASFVHVFQKVPFARISLMAATFCCRAINWR